MQRIDLGALSSLVPGQPRFVAHPGGVPPKRSIIVVRTDEGVRAYWNVCRHLPIPLDGGAGVLPPGRPGELRCATHAATYRALDGICVEGPCAGKALEALPLELEGDRIFALLVEPKVG